MTRNEILKVGADLIHCIEQKSDIDLTVVDINS